MINVTFDVHSLSSVTELVVQMSLRTFTLMISWFTPWNGLQQESTRNCALRHCEYIGQTEQLESVTASKKPLIWQDQRDMFETYVTRVFLVTLHTSWPQLQVYCWCKSTVLQPAHNTHHSLYTTNLFLYSIKYLPHQKWVE